MIMIPYSSLAHALVYFAIARQNPFLRQTRRYFRSWNSNVKSSIPRNLVESFKSAGEVVVINIALDKPCKERLHGILDLL